MYMHIYEHTYMYILGKLINLIAVTSDSSFTISSVFAILRSFLFCGAHWCRVHCVVQASSNSSDSCPSFQCWHVGCVPPLSALG